MTHNVEEFLNKNDMLCQVLIVKSTMVIDFKGLKEVALTHFNQNFQQQEQGTRVDAKIANENRTSLSDNIATEVSITALERHVRMPEVSPRNLGTN